MARPLFAHFWNRIVVPDLLINRHFDLFVRRLCITMIFLFDALVDVYTLKTVNLCDFWHAWLLIDHELNYHALT